MGRRPQWRPLLFLFLVGEFFHRAVPQFYSSDLALARRVGRTQGVVTEHWKLRLAARTLSPVLLKVALLLVHGSGSAG